MSNLEQRSAQEVADIAAMNMRAAANQAFNNAFSGPNSYWSGPNISKEQLKKLHDYEKKTLQEYDKTGVEEFFIPHIGALFKGIVIKDIYAHVDADPLAAWDELKRINAVSGTYQDFIKGKDTAGTEFNSPLSKLVTGVTGSVDNLGDSLANVAQNAKNLTQKVKDLTDPDNFNTALLIGGAVGVVVLILLLK